MYDSIATTANPDANSFATFFSRFSCADNPLICSCELIWFPNLLQDLKNRDDEMTQKKRPMCTMANEHREYFVQSMPVERMNCIGKNLGISSLSGANTSKRLQSNLSSCTVLILSLYSVITAYFLNWTVDAWWCRYIQFLQQQQNEPSNRILSTTTTAYRLKSHITKVQHHVSQKIL